MEKRQRPYTDHTQYERVYEETGVEMKQCRDERTMNHEHPTKLEETSGCEWCTILRATDTVCGLDHPRGTTTPALIDVDPLQDVKGGS